MKKVFGVSIVLCTLLLATGLSFGMVQLSDSEMDAITGQDGVNIVINDFEANLHVDALAWEDENGVGTYTDWSFDDASGTWVMNETAVNTLGGFIVTNDLNLNIYIDSLHNLKPGTDIGAKYGSVPFDIGNSRPLSLNVVSDSAEGKAYLNVGLPTLHLDINGATNMLIKLADNKYGTNNYESLFTLSLQDLQLETLGGDLKLYARTNEGFDLRFHDVRMYLYMKNLKIRDSEDNGEIVFTNFLVHDGSKGPFRINSGKIEIYQFSENGRSFVNADIFDLDVDLSIQMGNLGFCGTSLGSVDIEDIKFGDATGKVGHVSLSSDDFGIKAEIGARLDIGAIRYTYNSGATDFNVIEGIHLSQTATGDKTNPSTWSHTGEFLIGDFFVDNHPVSLDIATRADNSGKFISLNLPMKGALWVENVQVGGKDFGPVVLDGINMPLCNIRIPGGDPM